MPLNAPNLDSRTFADLVAEARQRIPRFTPEWTNLNDSDPGMTLAKLNAWLTETILFELNRVPALNYVKFLDLLQIKPIPARAATTELAVTLKKLSKPADPLTVLVPLGAKVAVDDPDLEQEVLFETDYTLVAVNAAIGAAIAPRLSDPQEPPTPELLTKYDDKTAETTWLHSFYPFGNAPAENAMLILGLVLRPHLGGSLDEFSQDGWPAGQLDLYVDAAQPYDLDEVGEVIDQAQSHSCLFPWQEGEAATAVDWQVYKGSNSEAEALDLTLVDDNDWQSLNVAGADETAGLTRSGHVRLEIPEQITRAGIDQLNRTVWKELGFQKPPSAVADLIDDLRNGPPELKDALEEKTWVQMGLPSEHLNAVLKCCPDGSEDKCGSGADIADAIEALPDFQNLFDPGKLSLAEWLELDAGYDAPPTPSHDGAARPLYWIRAILKENSEPALLSAIRLNTVPATAAATRVDERLGTSDGRPGQSFTLSKTPVYVDPESGAADLVLELTDEQGPTVWSRVDDFFGTSADSEVHTLDETGGRIAFGDGKRGRIPVAGATIRATRYRTGGGAIGNVGPGSITKLKGALRNVDRVTNPRAAADGSDAETLDDVILRAPHSLRVRDRAVSQDDFAFLAKQTPGVAVHKAFALGSRAYDKDADPKLQPQAGAVTVVILPANKDDRPLPSEAQLRAVCDYLEPRRLITTELYVAGPDYIELSELTATLRIDQTADIKAVSDAATAALLSYLHPLTGGPDGTGWPFGEAIYHADLYDLLLATDGVRRVANLSIGLEGGSDSDSAPDVLGIPEGHLPHLPRDVIKLKVIYDRFG